MQLRQLVAEMVQEAHGEVHREQPTPLKNSPAAQVMQVLVGVKKWAAMQVRQVVAAEQVAQGDVQFWQFVPSKYWLERQVIQVLEGVRCCEGGQAVQKVAELAQERQPGWQGWQKVPSKYWLEVQKRQVLVAVIRKWLATQEVQVVTLVEQPEQGLVQLTQAVPLNRWVGVQVTHWLLGVRFVPATQLLQTVRPEHCTHGATQAEHPTPSKYSRVPQVMQVLEGVRYLPDTQEVHSVSLFAQFWHTGEQAVHIGGAGAGGRY